MVGTLADTLCFSVGGMERRLDAQGNREEGRSFKKWFDPGLCLSKVQMPGPWDKERNTGLEISAGQSRQWVVVSTGKGLPDPRPQ